MSWECTETTDGQLRVGGGKDIPDPVIVKVTVLVPVPHVLVALTIVLEVPAADGVPEIIPKDVSTVSPGGRLEAPKLVGLFVAVI